MYRVSQSAVSLAPFDLCAAESFTETSGHTLSTSTPYWRSPLLRGGRVFN